MSAVIATAKVWTQDEYLELERASRERHEFYRGEIFAMSGASRQESTIVLNIGALLWNALRGRPCSVFVSDMRLRVEPSGLYTYPDVVALCGPAQFDPEHQDTLRSPRVIFEVLSDSTESYDRGKKFELYRTLPSLAEMVLVSQKEPLIEHFGRQDDGTWVLRERRAGQQVVLPSLGCQLSVDEVYLSVFETPTA